MSQKQFPARVRVAEIVRSRYPGHQRPLSWDRRMAGTDVIRSEEGETLELASDGGQSPPQPGWEVMLTGNRPDGTFTWTLYGLPR